MQNTAVSPAKPARQYSYVHRYVALVGVAALVVLGAVMDPTAFATSIARIPTALAPAIVWVAVTFGLVWILVDFIGKHLLGFSLRELIEEHDKGFARMLVATLLLAIPLVMFVATK